MLPVILGDFVRFHVCLSVAPAREEPARTFTDEVKDLLRGMNRTLSRSREESSRDGKLFCSGCKSGLLLFGASDPATIQSTHIQPNRQAENYKNQEMQERQREVTNVYTITRSNLASLRPVFLAPMKNPCLTVVQGAIFENSNLRQCTLLRLRSVPVGARCYGEIFGSQELSRILIRSNGSIWPTGMLQFTSGIQTRPAPEHEAAVADCVNVNLTSFSTSPS